MENDATPLSNETTSLDAKVVLLTEQLAEAQQRILSLESQLELSNTAGAHEKNRSSHTKSVQESLLRESESVARVGHEIWDHVQDRTVHVSEALANIYGLSVPAYMSKVQCLDDYFEFVVPEDLEAYKTFEARFVKEKAYNPLSVEYRITRGDGAIRYLQQTSKFIPVESGDPVRSISVIQDVTEYKTVQVELQKSRDALAETAEILSISASIAKLGYCVWDYDSQNFVHTSDAWATCFGMTVKEYMDIAIDLEGFLKLVHPDDRERYRKYYFDEWDLPEFEYKIIHSSGETRHVLQNYLTLERPGHETSIVTLQDITERKESEAQLIQSAKLITLGELAAGVAHELNQPLSTIVLAAKNVENRLSRGTLEDSYLSGKLLRIGDQVTRASNIIDHLRKFGREAKEEYYKVDIREAVLGAIDLIGEQLAVYGVEIETVFAKDFPLVMGHSMQLEQLFINLFSNSLYAIRNNSSANKKIVVEAIASKEGDALIKFSDTGGGIAANVLPNIFNPFYTTKSMEDGTGLGLSVSYGFVRNMGGKISAKNTLLGVCFEIKVPCAPEI